MFAVIFDLDGVISNTQIVHAAVESEILADIGIIMSADEITERYAGSSDDEMYKDIYKNYPGNTPYPPVAEMVERKWHRTHQRAIGAITAMPHAIELIQQVAQGDYKIAVASASRHDFINVVLNELNIEKYFPVRISSTDVANGKPAPDIFLKAAEELGVQPKDCLVIEDARNGMTGAKSAGMHCIGLTPSGTTAEYPADITVSSLGDITPKMLEQLFQS